MRTNQQIIYQLREASRLYRSENPHAHRLALLLLDNLVELLLRWRSEMYLLFDTTSWQHTRTHGRKVRDGVDRWHKWLLGFAKQKNVIVQAELDVLLFCHQQRNLAYHSGGDVPADLAVQLLFDFLRVYLPKHGSGKGITIYGRGATGMEGLDADATGSALVRVAEGSTERHGELPPDYWDAVVNKLFPTRDPDQMRGVMALHVEDCFSVALRRLERIKTNGTDIGLNEVVEWRFAKCGFWSCPEQQPMPRFSVRGTLNFYLAALPIEEELHDMTDMADRAKRLEAALKDHDPLERELTAKYLTAKHKGVTQALDRSIADGIKHYLSARRELQPILDALEELAFDVEGVIERARGK